MYFNKINPERFFRSKKGFMQTNLRTSTPRLFDYNTFLLLFCGMTALYWELLLIRWLSTCIRAVAYYSNFVLIAAFFGLGTGALLARYPLRLQRFIFPVISLAVLLGIFLSGFFHYNFSTADEFTWIGAPLGIMYSGDDVVQYYKLMPISIIILITYVITAAVFVIFGQWLGILFKTHKPLWAYSVEIAGSICGILLFAFISFQGFSAVAWFAVGFVLLGLIIEKTWLNYLIAAVCCGIVIVTTAPFCGKFIWSPYYRIYTEPLREIFDKETKKTVSFDRTIGYTLTVNNDYHQLMLDLSPKAPAHPFFTEWRTLYDFPYKEIDHLPDGDILIVGAGTGNDVSAALRNTNRTVYAVEIDPAIIELGEKLHFEQPYSNPRVQIINDDARSFFQKADRRFSLVVFGFLDSHTLLSSFASVRLDNFVYTRDSLEQVKRILVPGGKVFLTFASNRPWIHQRFLTMLDQVFDYPTETFTHGKYPNGITYVNGNARFAARGQGKEIVGLSPTDDWPFLYLKQPAIPSYYFVFIGFAVILGFASLLFVPKGERRIRFPYFFLGAAFFLLETSNVISLSLLYGSTWQVNIVVFTGILALVLLGNITSYFVEKPSFNLLIIFLAINLVAAYITPVSALFSINSQVVRCIAAVLLFLGPVYFASLFFATLIKDEINLYQAYGSNILGAVVGGVCEYLSLMFGFKFLLILTLLFYLIVYLLLPKESKGGALHSSLPKPV